MLNRILELLKIKGIKKNKLAQLTGLAPTTIYSVLKDDDAIKCAKIETLRPIAEVLGVSLDYIITGKTETKKIYDYSITAIKNENEKIEYIFNKEDFEAIILILNKFKGAKNDNE